MAYHLGQNNNNNDEILFEEELPPLMTNGNGNGVPWWKKLWTGTKEVLSTGVEIFTEVAPFIFSDNETVITTPRIITTTDPSTGLKQTVTDIPYTPGQVIPPGTIIVKLPSGQTVARRTQKAGIMPPWAMPVALGIGGVILMNMMGKKRRR